MCTLYATQNLCALAALRAQSIVPAFALEFTAAAHAWTRGGNVFFRAPQRHALRQAIGKFRFRDAITHNSVVLIIDLSNVLFNGVGRDHQLFYLAI